MNRNFRCNLGLRQDNLIAESYAAMCGSLRRFVAARVGNAVDAEDIVQDVFARVLEYNTLLTPETFPRFVYRITRNLITDWFRRHACRRSAAEYFACFTIGSTRNTEEQIAVDDLLRLEDEIVAEMPPRRAYIYCMYVHGNASATEISDELKLSRRTVENHIFCARKDMRSAMLRAI